MSNKQVAAIFIIGVALLLAAFWAGLVIVKQDGPASANQTSSVAPNAANNQANKPPANANLTAQPPGTPASDSDTRWVVVLGNFGTPEQADQLKSEMRRDYPSTHVEPPSGDNTLYRVVIGPYNRHDAEMVAADLSNKRRGIMIQPRAQN